MSGSWPAGGRRWSHVEIASDVADATAEFRARRLGEPLERYLSAFDGSQAGTRQLITQLNHLLTDADGGSTFLQTLWGTEAGRIGYRYLGAPPISTDDLETLAEAKLSAAAAQDIAGKRQRLIAVMRAIIDPRRFPWVAEQRAPTEAELNAAVLATTTLIASQRVQTLRRGDEKSMVEGAVKGLLVGMGWQPAARPPNGIQNLLNDSPPPKHFLSQINLGSDNADVVVRLGDGRLLAIECKGSNSEINSRKRLNKEAVKNAQAWLARFGDQVVPAVALQGVFKGSYVAEAQATPMLIFWSHRLDDLRSLVAACR